MEEAIQQPFICQKLIGRASELSALRTLIEQAREGEGRIILISGEAGIGKTRMIAEAGRYATGQGFLLLQGACFPTDRACPYAPLLDILRSPQARELISSKISHSSAAVQFLAQFQPDLLSASLEFPQLPHLEPEQEKRRLFSALAQAFTEQAATQSLLLIIEDLHWSDDTSLEFLQYLARICSGFPLLILATYRSDEVQPGLKRWLAYLDRYRLHREFTLGRLRRDQVDAMLQAIMEQHNAPPIATRLVPGSLLETLFPLTEGNPFFIEELFKSLSMSGELSASNADELPALHIPRSIEDTVQQRMESISESAKQLLLLAAVAGRRFHFQLLQHVVGCDEHQLLRLIKELVAAQLVVEESEDSFAFRHALTQQTLYAGLLLRERKTLHQSIAHALEQLYADQLDAHLGDFAFHFYEAASWEKAGEYTLEAGKQALALYAPQAAINHLTRALSARYHLTVVPSPDIFRLRGQAHELVGEFNLARSDYEAALQIARSGQNSHEEWEALLHLGMLWAGRDYERSGEYYRHAYEVARALQNQSCLARSLNRLGNWHLNVEHPHEALDLHQQALVIFKKLQDQHGIAETLDLLGMTCYLDGDLIKGTNYYQQAVRSFEQMGDRQGLTSSLASLTMRSPMYQTDTLIAGGSFADALTDGARALAIARETEQRSAEAYAMIFLAFCLGPQGEFSRALELAEKGQRIAEEIDHRQWITAALCARGVIHRDLLALSTAEALLKQALDLAHETASNHWIHCATGYLASTYVLQKDFHRAEEILTATLTQMTAMRTPGQRLAWTAKVELLLARRESEQALHLLEQLWDSAKNLNETGDIPRLSKLQGEALLQLNQSEKASDCLQHAQASARQQGSLNLLWQIDLGLGKLYRSQRQYDAAEEAFNAARSTAELLSSKIASETLRSGFLQQVNLLLPGTTSPTSRRAIKKAYGGLTEREREIATYIAQGRSNREISEDLVVSERTIETHVGNILAKLSFNARTQIAAWAVSKGLISTNK